MRFSIETTYRKNKPLASYIYFLSISPPGSIVYTQAWTNDIIIDYSESNKLVGIELLNPSETSVEEINEVFKVVGLASLTNDETTCLSKTLKGV